MKIVNVKERNSSLIDALLAIWEDSVRTTHLFLSENEILDIKKYVPTAIKEVPVLFVAFNDDNSPFGFMGIDGDKLEMLFISSHERGKGIGKAFIESADLKEIVVNEQNPLAKGFYEHMGFKAYKRSEIDEQGQPYPILFMRRG